MIHDWERREKVLRKMKVEEVRSEVTRKHKSDHEADNDEHSAKKGRITEDPQIKAEFEKLCKAITDHLSVQQMSEILEVNGQDASGDSDAVVRRCQDMLFYGPPDNCPICGCTLEISEINYYCKGVHSDWSTCTYTTRDPARRDEPIKLPEYVKESAIDHLLREFQDRRARPHREMPSTDKHPFEGMTISLVGRLTRTHQYWKSEIEKHGGKVADSVIGATCVVVSPAERDRAGSSKLAEAKEKSIPIVREAWLRDSLEKNEARPLIAYDIVSDLAVSGERISLYKQDLSEEPLEAITPKLKIFGKRGIHKDTKLQEKGGQILEKDGILYNCAFVVSDRERGVNDFCIMQIITVPQNRVYMYYKRGKIGDKARAKERLDEWENVDDATKEFSKSFEGLTGNEFEPWEREKKVQKRPQKFFPIDMDDGVEVRHGALGLRQLGIAGAHCKLEQNVANLMKVLCSQEIYRYALMDLGLDIPDIPLGMVTDIHLRRCEDVLLEFAQKLKSQKGTGQKNEALLSDLSQRIFTLLPSARPYIFRDFHDVADHAAAAIETIRDITRASYLIGNMSGSTLDDPLSDRYKKLGCAISPVEKYGDDYKMIAKYLEKTYEPVKLGEISYGVSIENVFAGEPSACPSVDEIKKLPNKVLLWYGTRSSNLLRHLQKGFLPAICSLPVPGYMFGKAIVCSDTAAESARYCFTAVDKPQGFLVLAVASLGEEITQMTNPPEDTTLLEQKKLGVIGLGRKKTDESEHFVWKDDIKVPCGSIVESEHKDSPIEYNEYAVYDPQQVSIKFLVAILFVERNTNRVQLT
ncbi:hypothetical protein BUALT_Bualt13G0059400 [Buddleja alternifolia]|uniref:Poly [ADP-ribose] polymerase n=1 Tax=Buddleja alternifolia TaxID=168488 RepID=A0AAV6WRU8_9LAMI|nr:hypothetical protein BUALT_Bualt13G0059400 [Buddleja alternifolia]